MLTSKQIQAERTVDAKFLGRFLGIADSVGSVANHLVLSALKETLAEYTAEYAQFKEAPVCDGCGDVPAEPGKEFCAPCQREIDLDSRTEDPAKTQGVYGRGL